LEVDVTQGDVDALVDSQLPHLTFGLIIFPSLFLQNKFEKLFFPFFFKRKKNPKVKRRREADTPLVLDFSPPSADIFISDCCCLLGLQSVTQKDEGAGQLEKLMVFLSLHTLLFNIFRLKTHRSGGERSTDSFLFF
jgi:hypothetical protein